MESIYHYLKKYCDETASERPISEEDAVILCTLCYLLFEKVITSDEKMRLVDFAPLLKELGEGAVFGRSTIKLFKKAVHSRRYKDVILEKVTTIADPKKSTQFAAMIFRFDLTHIFVAYRGTDLTFTGWKEDCMLALSARLEGHIEAGAYLDSIIEENPRTIIHVGGHSKGGNLATYSLYSTKPENVKQIERVYDLDGPGFKTDLFKQESLHENHDKIIKIIPQDDIVGQLLDSNPKYRVIKSSRLGASQHITFYWHFKDGKLRYVPDVSQFTKRFSHNMKLWLRETPKEDLRMFVNHAFNIFEAAGIENFGDVKSFSLKKIREVVDNYSNLDEKYRENIKMMISAIVRIYFTSMFKVMKPKEKLTKKKTK